MRRELQTLAWIACVVYSTIPVFWLMIHPRAAAWRNRGNSIFRILVLAWIVLWIGVAALTAAWRDVSFYRAGALTLWSWIPAALFFAIGIFLYWRSSEQFSWAQLGGLPEVLPRYREQRLVTSGIRARVRHPVYLGHLCEMLAWSVGTGLVVCWALVALAIATGAVMIRAEDAELQNRFGEEYATYRARVPAVFPRLG